MSITIYEKTPSGLYATGDRTVSTFPSGLVRVEQTFVCRSTSAATNRATLAVGNNFPNGSTPAIDGLKIFPAPQERERDDGFTEFIVTAYGRKGTLSQERIFFEYDSNSWYLFKTKKAQITYVTNYDNSQLVYPIATPSYSVKLAASSVDFDEFTNNYWFLENILEVDFGYFKEVTLNYKSFGY